VKAARTSRVGAKVSYTDADGVEQVEEFDSTAKAFKALRLPLSCHVVFRLKMRKDGTNAIEHEGTKFTFTAVEKGNPADAKRAANAVKVAERNAKKAAAKAAKDAKKLAAKQPKPDAEEVEGVGQVEEV
jgi:hypothetical protein